MYAGTGTVLIVLEHGFTPIAAFQQVINGAGVLDAHFASHATYSIEPLKDVSDILHLIN